MFSSLFSLAENRHDFRAVWHSSGSSSGLMELEIVAPPLSQIILSRKLKRLLSTVDCKGCLAGGDKIEHAL